MFGKIPFFYYLTRPLIWYLRRWDKIAAQRPDVMIANSTAVKKRIRKYYKRDSTIIFSPTEIDKFRKVQRVPREDFFLYVSRLIPYKRADLAIEAFNELRLPLVIVGIGSEEKRYKAMAAKNIKFVGELTDRQLAGYYHKTQALIFPQEEDFGIVVAEANAAGTPVIAFKAGGALDTVIDGKTGVFFDKQNKDSLIKVVKRFQKMRFDRRALTKNAEKFSKERFKKNFLRLVKDVKR
jgi:glycosyltransferase involved in cell wall biosynthesis